MDEEKSQGYGKRPMWQWIVLYVIIAIFIYGLIYYFVFAKKGSSYSYTTGNNPTQSQQKAPKSTTNTNSSNIYLVKSSASKGSYVTDFQGKTLYTFDKDSSGVSNCNGGCAQAWPPYSSGATAQSTFPAHISVIKRSDGSQQFAWDNKPLYYFASDTNAGDINGDGVGGTWHIVKQ